MYIHLSGTQLPYSSKWFYRARADDGDFTDSFVSSVKLTLQEMLDVQSYYAGSLDGYNGPNDQEESKRQLDEYMSKPSNPRR